MIPLDRKLKSLISEAILEDNQKKYYVGKIILDTENINPQKYLGFGTWEYWGSGRVPVGVDTSDSNFNEVEKTGGSKYMQKHKHQDLIWMKTNVKLTGEAGTGVDKISIETGKGNPQGYSISPMEAGTGDSQNLQPYITCYMWKRTA